MGTGRKVATAAAAMAVVAVFAAIAAAGPGQMLVDVVKGENWPSCAAFGSSLHQARDVDAIVVLGYSVYPDGVPYPQLQARLRAAESLCGAVSGDPDADLPPVLLTGGVPLEYNISEANSMAEWLRARDAPLPCPLLQEPFSHSTIDNARYSRVLLRHWFHQHHAAEADEWQPHVVIVTNRFHAYRARRTFERVLSVLPDSTGRAGAHKRGARVSVCVPDDARTTATWRDVLREVLALAYYRAAAFM